MQLGPIITSKNPRVQSAVENRAFLKADPTPTPGGVLPSQGLGASQQPFPSPGTPLPPPSGVQKKIAVIVTDEEFF